MTDTVRIYHNPRCSKSRETLALLRDRGVEPTVVEYLKAPPTRKEIERLIEMLGGDPHVLVRAKEPAYKVSGLSKTSSSREVAAAVAAEPVLLERPIVVKAGKAAIGRPPESVLDIL